MILTILTSFFSSRLGDVHLLENQPLWAAFLGAVFCGCGIGLGFSVGYDRMSYASEFTLFGDLRTNDFMAPSSQGQTDEIRQYAYSPNGTYPDAGYQIFYKALSNDERD